MAAPLIICESRSLKGVLTPLAERYACPITSTNGQARGHLINEVAPSLDPCQHVLYLGDWDHCGHQIEAHTRTTLLDAGPFARADNWQRVALTTAQVETFDLPVIRKTDRRYNGNRAFDAVETEALSQRGIVDLVRARLDALMDALPEPLATVFERERHQRREAIDRLTGGSASSNVSKDGA